MTDSNETKHDCYERWHSDPTNWKWGLFYFNREDKRIFPPKRFKSMGWTVNFANPASIAALTAIVVFIILLTNWLR